MEFWKFCVIEDRDTRKKYWKPCVLAKYMLHRVDLNTTQWPRKGCKSKLNSPELALSAQYINILYIY